ncbi:MAG: GyrI-like domain-containing protein [Pseudobdellovibrionaceae bacterium]
MRQQGILLSLFLVLVSTNVFAQKNSNQNTKENEMNYEIVVKETSAQPALVIKGKVNVEEVGEAIGGILGKIGAYLETNHINPTGAPFTRILNFENGIFEFEAGFPVSKKMMGYGEIMATELPKTKVATTIHTGGQDKSEEAYKALHIWMKKNNIQEAGAPWEVYDSESKMEIFYPIL